MDLGEYLVAASQKPWRWGTEDCCTFAGDWVLDQTGADPIATWRGYSTEAETEGFIAQAGSLLALWEQGLSGILPRRDDARPGDVGVVIMPNEDGKAMEVGAIFTGKRWAFRTPRGLACVSIDPEQVGAIWGR